jgi:hypothetical protein
MGVDARQSRRVDASERREAHAKNTASPIPDPHLNLRATVGPGSGRRADEQGLDPHRDRQPVLLIVHVEAKWRF